MTLTRPETFILHNGDKAPLPFDISEYDARLAKLRTEMAARGVDAVVLTSMQKRPLVAVVLFGGMIIFGWLMQLLLGTSRKKVEESEDEDDKEVA